MRIKPFILLQLLTLSAINLHAQPILSNLSLTPQPNNVLRYTATFTTSQAARGYVEYYYWDGTDTIRAKTHFTDSTTSHALTLMGLVPQQTYTYRAWAFDQTGNYPSPTNTFTTSSIPANVTHGTITSIQGVAGNPVGYPMTNTAIGNPDRYLQVHDRKGHIIWYERMPGIAAANVDGPCQSFTYSPSTRTVLLTDCGKVSEIALDGTVQNTLNMGSLAPGWMPHHDVFRTATGNLLILAANVDTIDKSSVGGDPNALVVGPGILEFTPTGTLVWSWSAFDHLDPLTSPGPGGDWVPKIGPQAINWLDANSVMLDGDGNPMLSFGGTSQVVKIARTGSNIVWTCGDNGDIEILPPDSFNVFHGLRPSRPGYYLSLDHRGLDSLTRIIEWWIDFSYIQARYEMTWVHVLPAADFSADNGNVDLQRNGNYMIGSQDGRSVTELSSNRSLLWHATYDSSLHRAFWVEDFYDRIHPQYLGDTIVCSTDSSILLEATPTGGIWSGPFVSGDTFNAALAGAGIYPLTYQYGPEQFTLDITVDPTADCGVGFIPPSTNTLTFAAYPNPFQDRLHLVLELERQEELTVEVFAMDGRLVLREELGKWAPGHHEWDFEVQGGDWKQGVYCIRFSTGSGKAGTKLVARN